MAEFCHRCQGKGYRRGFWPCRWSEACDQCDGTSYEWKVEEEKMEKMSKAERGEYALNKLREMVKRARNG